MALRRYFGKISPLSINQLVGHNGELVIDEATDKVYIMDGVTPGGHEIANVQANLNFEYTNVNPAVSGIYNLGSQNYNWSNLYLSGTINPSQEFGSLRINADRVYSNILYASTAITSDGSITANNFVELSAIDYTGYTFGGYGNLTGLVHANIGNVLTLSIIPNAVTSFTAFSNGFNTLSGKLTTFYSNIFVSASKTELPNFTQIGLLPDFTPLNAKLTYVDNVNNYSQFLLQNKSSGSNGSGDIVVTADNGTDSTHYIDLGINSSTFNDGGIDGPDDGYLIVEGGHLLVSTLTNNKDIIFATGGHNASNVVARFKSHELNVTGNIIPAANVTYSLGNVNYQWQDLYVSNNTIYMAGVPVQLTNGNLVVNGNVVGGGFGSINQALNTTSNPTFNNLSATGNVTIQGNLIVNGNTTTVSTQNLIINDNIIYIANANPDNSLDIGFAGHFTAGIYQHTGLVRQASSNVWKLFSNISAEPGNTIDFTNAIYDGLQTGALVSPTITDIYNNLSSLTSNASTQASNLATLTSNAASQASDISTLYSNAATQESNLGAIVGGTVTLANVKTTGGLYWANGVSALVSAYGNTQVSAYYVANTVATSNVQILNNGNIRLPTGATINESAGSGTITLSPNTTVNALAGVAIGGLGYLLSPNGTRNAVLNYNGVNGQMGVYILNTYGNQANAIVNGGSNNYGNIGGITSFFGNAFVSNIYSPNYLYPNGTSILSGISGTYGNTQVAAYLPTYTGTVMASYLTSPGGTDLTILPSTATGTRSYGHFVPQFSNTYNLGSGTLYWQNAWIGNITVSTGINWANGVSVLTSSYGNTQVAAYLPVYNGNIGAGYVVANGYYNEATTTPGLYIGNAGSAPFSPRVGFFNGNAAANWQIDNYNGSFRWFTPGVTRMTLDYFGNLSLPGAMTITNSAISTSTTSGALTVSGGAGIAGTLYTGNIITTNGVYWANGVAYSTGGGSTYSNTDVVSMLGANTSVIIGNTNTYPLQANTTQMVVGNSTILATGGSTNSTTTYLLNNIYYDTSGSTRYRNTGTGAVSIAMGGASGITITGTTSAVTGNAATGTGIWVTLNGTALSTVNGIAITASGALTTTSGSLISGSATSSLFNTTATTINFGGAATTINMGNSLSNVYVGSNVGNVYVGNLITTSGILWSNGVAYSGGGSGTPSGGNTMVQFNDGGAFGGATFLQYNKTSGNLVSNSTTTSISTTTGAVVIGGGVGIGGNIYAGGDIFTNTGNLRSTSSIGNLFNFSATTVNIGNAATSIYMGSSTANVTVAGNVVAKNSLYTDNHLYANGVPYAGTYSNSNIASYLPTYSGNVGAGNLIGTSANVTITSGANVWTFDNTGNLSLPNLSATYILAANTNGNINVNTIGTGAVNVSGNLTIGGINAGYAPNRPAFRVYGSNSYQWQGGNTIVAGSVDYNQGSYYNAITGIFTAPIAGLYHAYATLRVGTNNGMNQASIQKNSSNTGANVISFWETDTNTGTATHFSMTGYAKLVAGDTIRLQSIVGNINLDANDSWGVTYIG